MSTLQVAQGLGVPHLDNLLAPVPRGSAIALANDPGVDAEPFLLQAANTQLIAGGTVVFLLTGRAPAAVRASMMEYGFDVHECRDRLLFVDAYSPLLGTRSDAPFALEDPDPSALAPLLEGVAARHPGAMLVVDALSTFLDRAGEERFAAALPPVLAAMRRFRMSASLFTRWPYGATSDEALAAFDAVVTLRGVEDRVTYRQYFEVERAAWAPRVDPRPRLYKAMKPGGVSVYIPKILVTGPAGSGKSTFVHAVSEAAVSADARGTTVAMDHGHVALDGLTTDIFGTPGHARFDPLLKVLAAQALGVVVVVDSTDPDTFPRAREMMGQTWKHGLPAIIAANKQDQAGAMPPEAVARYLGAPDHARVVGCNASDPQQARRVLKQLIDQILERSVTR